MAMGGPVQFSADANLLKAYVRMLDGIGGGYDGEDGEGTSGDDGGGNGGNVGGANGGNAGTC